MKAQTKESQSLMTPETSLQYLKEGNTRFRNNLRANRDLIEQVKDTSEGQFPFATILSCIDSRVSSELILATTSEIPDIFKIQIMTITGKVVREIHKDELGAINIGRNITDFAWNGTDTYGDRLANGLYLYHVITKINSDDIEHRDTSADGYFKKGFGKMYLFR